MIQYAFLYYKMDTIYMVNNEQSVLKSLNRLLA